MRGWEGGWLIPGVCQSLTSADLQSSEIKSESMRSSMTCEWQAPGSRSGSVMGYWVCDAPTRAVHLDWVCFCWSRRGKKREKSHRKSFCVWVSDGNRVNERIKDEKLVLKNVHKPQERKMWNVKQEMSLRSDKIKDSVWHFLVSVVEATRTQLTQIDCEWD